MPERILIVEDSTPIREVITEFLSSEGHLCDAVAKGEAALALLQTHTYDLILTDLRLPGVDGFTLIREANRLQPETPKIIMTAFTDITDTLEAIRLGAYDFIRKPIPRLEELGVVVARALEHRRLLLERDAQRKELARLNEQLEAEVERRTQELSKANQQLRTLAEMKNHLLMSVSHELRTPLVSVRGYTEMFLQGHVCEIPPHGKRYLEICLRNIDKLLSLIDSLVKYAEMAQGRVTLKIEPLDLCEIAQGVAQTFLQTHTDGRHPLSLECPSSPMRVMGDREILTKAFDHLLENAAKFNPQGCRIEIRIEPVGKRLVKISVIDNGIGIPHDAQPHIFERFFQVNTGPTRSFGGTGKGLAIVRDNLRLLGSEIRVASEPGAGASFYWTMPLWEEETQPTPATSSS